MSLLSLQDAELAFGVHPLLDRAELDAIRRVTPERIFRAEYLAEFLDDAGEVFRGLRDAATIGELVVARRRDGGDVGAQELTARYEHMRRADVTSPVPEVLVSSELSPS